MEKYQGTISGIGNAITRQNEITGDNLAMFRNIAIGYKDGVLKRDGHDFEYSIDKYDVKISDGMCFAYGYFGYSAPKSFSILPPAVESYFVIYARIDRSVIPNGYDLFIKNNYASPNIGTNTFRQDVLTTIKTGVYELPLWVFRVTNQGIDEFSFKDLRPLRTQILKANNSDYATCVLKNGKLEDGVTAVTQTITDSSKKVATTEFVQKAIRAEISK